MPTQVMEGGPAEMECGISWLGHGSSLQAISYSGGAMRVLMFSWEYPPHVVGGLGKHVAGGSKASRSVRTTLTARSIHYLMQ